jgi:hypothetical protein
MGLQMGAVMGLHFAATATGKQELPWARRSDGASDIFAAPGPYVTHFATPCL